MFRTNSYARQLSGAGQRPPPLLEATPPPHAFTADDNSSVRCGCWVGRPGCCSLGTAIARRPPAVLTGSSQATDAAPCERRPCSLANASGMPGACSHQQQGLLVQSSASGRNSFE